MNLFRLKNYIDTAVASTAADSLTSFDFLQEEECLKWYVTGLIDAEGSFGVHLVKKDNNKTGYGVLVYFEIALNKKDKNLLYIVQEVLGVRGELYYNQRDDTYKLKISNLLELCNVIVPHFNKYPLFTQKRVDFLLMCQVLKILEDKRHLTLEGLREIVQLKSSMNLGLSDKLANDFPEIQVLPRQIVSTGLPNLDWLSGFIEGEGCFFVSVYSSPKSKLKLAVQLVFKITQHIRDVELLLNITKVLGCGRVETRRHGDACDFAVTSFKEIDKSIIPYLSQPRYRLKGLKLNNFKDFNKVYEMMARKEHLSEHGLGKIIEIKNGMNSARV